jgi:hypothetical protein
VADIDATLVLPVAMAALSLFVSLVVAWRNWRYSETGVRYVAWNQYMNALFDLDRQLITRPELWAIFDNHELATKRAEDAESRGRREAFIYYHLNLFETVFNNYNNMLSRTRIDEQYWQSWDAWIRYFLVESREARELFTKPLPQRIFFRGFVDYANGIIADWASRAQRQEHSAMISDSKRYPGFEISAEAGSSRT